MSRKLIVNADDLGASREINRGIAEAHMHGIVTSASLMVTGSAALDGAAIARQLPRLSLGLHWDVWGENERQFDVSDEDAVRDELKRQLERFEQLTGQLPTHVDSHQHAHRAAAALPVFCELLQPLGVPVRGASPIRYVGGFYAQWEWGVTNLHYVSVEFLAWILRNEVNDGWTELGCHPGYAGGGFESVYLAEREAEVRTLTDPRVADMIDELGIELASFAHHPRAVTTERPR